MIRMTSTTCALCFCLAGSALADGNEVLVTEERVTEERVTQDAAREASAVAHAEAAAPLVQSVVLDASLEEVWQAFTTSEGLERWMAPLVDVDLRVGGAIRSNYNAAGSFDDATSIENQILSYEPLHMLSMRTTRYPDGYPFVEASKGTWAVLRMTATLDGRTRLTIAGMGYTNSEASQTMRGFYEKANMQVLEALVDHFDNGAGSTTLSPEEQWNVLNWYVGGTWRAEAAWSDGTPLVLRETFESMLGGKAIRSSVYPLNQAGDEYHRYDTVYRWDEELQTIATTTYRYDGGVTHGRVIATSHERLYFPEQAGSPIRQEIERLDEATAVWRVWDVSGEQPVELIEAKLHRTAS